MKKLTFFVAAILIGLGLPMLSYAATFHYVDLTGEIGSIEAPNASVALATAPDIHPNSGVVLDAGLLEEGDNAFAFGVGGDADVAGVSISVVSDGLITFQYVDVNGDVDSVEARNATEAMLLADNIHPNSGVYIAETNPIPESVDVSVSQSTTGTATFGVGGTMTTDTTTGSTQPLY
jgi:hypothetical protein